MIALIEMLLAQSGAQLESQWSQQQPCEILPTELKSVLWVELSDVALSWQCELGVSILESMSTAAKACCTGNTASARLSNSTQVLRKRFRIHTI